MCNFTHCRLYSIVRGRVKPLPRNRYSMHLKNVCMLLLSKQPAKRPSSQQLLRVPFVQKEIRHHLSPANIEDEFCHTVLHSCTCASDVLVTSLICVCSLIKRKQLATQFATP
jgi:hypothetical protein